MVKIYSYDEEKGEWEELLKCEVIENMVKMYSYDSEMGEFSLQGEMNFSWDDKSISIYDEAGCIIINTSNEISDIEDAKKIFLDNWFWITIIQ